ncbi:MAG: class I SAM-dependent methyltransferase, partial [Patescibacteria group bacterium]
MKKNNSPVLSANQWDEVAELYHKGIGIKGDKLHEKHIDPVIFEFLKGIKGARVLDAGCGNGYLIPKLAPYANSMVGIDYSKRLLTFAKEQAKPHKNVVLLHANLLKKLPLAADSFDVVIANMVLQYLPQLN